VAVVACIWLEPVVTCYLYISHISHLIFIVSRMILSIVFGLVLLVNVSLSASAPDDSEVHFERFEQEHSLAQGLEPRDGRQGGSLLGCLMGCTRELRPVRGEQRNEEQIFANKCTFDIAGAELTDKGEEFDF